MGGRVGEPHLWRFQSVLARHRHTVGRRVLSFSGLNRYALMSFGPSLLPSINIFSTTTANSSPMFSETRGIIIAPFIASVATDGASGPAALNSPMFCTISYMASNNCHEVLSTVAADRAPIFYRSGSVLRIPIRKRGDYYNPAASAAFECRRIDIRDDYLPSAHRTQD